MLSSHMIDVETTNELLQSENAKLKTEMQNLKKHIKAMGKKIETMENEKKNTLQEITLKPSTLICHQTVQTEDVPSRTKISQDKTSQDITSPNNIFTSNPFHVLSTAKDEEYNTSSTSQSHVHPISHDNKEMKSADLTNPSIPPHDNYPSRITPQQNEITPDNLNEKPGHVLLIDSNGKFIDTKRFSSTSIVLKSFTLTIASATDTLNKENFGTPSTIIIHTGTNDIEKTPLDACFENFQVLVDIAAQKYPRTKIIISSLLVRNDAFDTLRSQLNGRLGRLRSYPNVHFVNNEIIASDMLHDQKHVKRRKIGALVSNLKDCAFNRISRRLTSPQRVAPRHHDLNSLQHFPLRKDQISSLNTTPTTTPAIKQQPVQPPLQQQPRLFTEVVKSPGKHCV